VFREPLGTYDICDVCGWEDDEVQQRWPGYRGGANNESLCESQSRFLPILDAHADLARGLRRHTAWRPLRPQECVDSAEDPHREPYIYYWDRDRQSNER
jgi:hypothetical protein